MNLTDILALSRNYNSRSWFPAMTNSQLSIVFGEKPSRASILSRMASRPVKKATATTPTLATATPGNGISML